MAHGVPRQATLQLCIIVVSSASNNDAKLQPQNCHGWECGSIQTACFGFLKHFKNSNAHHAGMLDARMMAATLMLCHIVISSMKDDAAKHQPQK